MLVALALARQGQLSSFVSRPVLRGFAFALAITIVIKQLPDALGLPLPPGAGNDPVHLLWHASTHLLDWHMPSMAVALAAGLLLVWLKRWPQIPASLLVMVLALLAAHTWPLQAWGVQEIGTFERPTFHPAWPELPFADWLRVVELSFGLVMLVFAESWGSMRSTALQHGDRLNANRELAVLGACNMASGLLQGMAVGAGFSATAANAGAGAQSRAAGLVALAALQRFSQPVVHELGALGDSRNFFDIATQAGATVPPGLLILRPEEPLFFGSAERVTNEVRDRAEARAGVRAVVLSLEESADLDSTAVECLLELN